MRNYFVILFLFFANSNLGLLGQSSSATIDVADIAWAAAPIDLRKPDIQLKFDREYLKPQNEPFYLSDFTAADKKINEVHIAFTQNPELKSEFPGQFQYYAKGLKIHRRNGPAWDTPYSDSAWSHPVSDTIKFSIPVETLLAGENGGYFLVIFDSLMRVDSKGRKTPLSIHGFWTHNFEIYRNKELLDEKYGFPKVSLLVNGKKFESGIENRVPRDAKVTLILEVDPQLLKDHPEECNFMMDGAEISERGCFGLSFMEAVKEKSEWGSATQLEIPVKDLKISFGGQFYIQVGDIYRKGTDGKVYYQQPETYDSLESSSAVAIFYLEYLK